MMNKRKILYTIFAVILSVFLTAGCTLVSSIAKDVKDIIKPGAQMEAEAEAERSKTIELHKPQQSPLSPVSESPAPELSETPAIKSGTRNNPLPLGTAALFDGSDTLFDTFKAEITLTGIVRGEEAWQMAEKGNKFNKKPEAGKEYLFAKFRIKALKSKDDAKIGLNTSLFELVSQGGNKYGGFVSVSGVVPALNDMYAGASQEGYIFFQVDTGDTNPVIVFLERDGNGIWFTTDKNAKLADGSEVYTPSETDGWQPPANSAKGTRLNPVALKETAVFDGMETMFDTYKAEISLVEVVRGEKAWKMAEKGNMFNQKPEKGKEYLFAKFKIKALDSRDDAGITMNPACFELVSQDGNKYNDFVTVSGVKPVLADMYKGAEQQGYAFFLVNTVDEAPLIVFLERNDNGVWFRTIK